MAKTAANSVKTDAVGNKEVKQSAGISTYGVDELVQASEKVFGVQKECASAALKTQDKKMLTLAEAKNIVNNFMHKEVR